MDSKKAEVLLKKYWEGKSSQAEEKELKTYFSLTHHSDELSSEYFKTLDKKSTYSPLQEEFDKELLSKISENKKDSRQNAVGLKYWYIAASLVLIISVGIIFKDQIFKAESPAEIVLADTFEDPEEAFEETKKALMFISSKLNHSSEYATHFSKFEQSQKNLKQN